MTTGKVGDRGVELDHVERGRGHRGDGVLGVGIASPAQHEQTRGTLGQACGTDHAVEGAVVLERQVVAALAQVGRTLHRAANEQQAHGGALLVGKGDRREAPEHTAGSQAWVEPTP